MSKIQAGSELFQADETAPWSGQYVLVDEHGKKQAYTIYLNEGETFPRQSESGFFYMLDQNEDNMSIDNEVIRKPD